MNLEKLNHWLTLAANLGVLAGIIFLAIEIQQSTNAQLATSRQQVMEADLVLVTNLIQYPELLVRANDPEPSGLETGRLRGKHLGSWGLTLLGGGFP